MTLSILGITQSLLTTMKLQNSLANNPPIGGGEFFEHQTVQKLQLLIITAFRVARLRPERCNSLTCNRIFPAYSSLRCPSETYGRSQTMGESTVQSNGRWHLPHGDLSISLLAMMEESQEVEAVE